MGRWVRVSLQHSCSSERGNPDRTLQAVERRAKSAWFQEKILRKAKLHPMLRTSLPGLEVDLFWSPVLIKQFSRRLYFLFLRKQLTHKCLSFSKEHLPWKRWGKRKGSDNTLVLKKEMPVFNLHVTLFGLRLCVLPSTQKSSTEQSLSLGNILSFHNCGVQSL